MRALAALSALLLGGCQLLIDLDDPVGNTCSPFFVDEDCEDGETCEFDDDDNGGYLACRDPGGGDVGDVCENVGDCLRGLTCADNICRTFCSELGADCGHPEEGECLYQARGLLVCDSECDVLDPGSCGLGRFCTVSLNDQGRPIALCFPDSYVGNREYLESCTYLTECVPGLACYDTDPADGVDLGVCVNPCVVDSACPTEGTTCEDVFLETLHGQPVGLCPPP